LKQRHPPKQNNTHNTSVPVDKLLKVLQNLFILYSWFRAS